MTHPSPKRNMIPKAVLMRSGLVSLTTARPVNTAQPKTTGNPQMDLQDQGVIDCGCSMHMTGNMSYLTDFEEICPVVADEKTQKKNDVKARSMLLMALPNEHLLIFNQYKDAKTLFAAIQTRFGGNDATKKTQKTFLKQMYENFSAPSTESLDSIFNRLQKILSHLAIPRMSFDDLYNNFKIIKQEVKGTASSSLSLSSQNMAFVSSSSSTNKVNTTYEVSTANTRVSPTSTQVSTASTQVSTANLRDATVYAVLANQPNGSQLVHEDLEQINKDDLGEMDLKWQLALLSMRTRKECKGPRNQDNMSRNQDSSRRTINVEEISSKAMLAIDGAGFDWSFMFNLATYKSGLASVEEQLVFYKKNEVLFCEQLAVLKRDISYKDSEISVLKSELEKLKQEKESNQLKIEKFDNASKRYGPKTSKSVSEDTSNEVRKSPDASLVEELVSNDKLEKKTVFPTIAKINFVRPQQQEKLVRKPVKYAEMYRSFDHVQANCNYHQRERMVSGNNYTRVNYNYSAKKANPSAHRNIVPRAVLMKTGLSQLNTARPVNTAHPKTTVYSARPMSCFSKSSQSTVKRPYQIKTTLAKKNFSQKVNTAKGSLYTARSKAVNTARPNSPVVNAVRANQVNAVKASACWVWRPTKLNSASITFKRHNYGYPQKEDQGYVDNGCSRHMTSNMSYLSNFKEFDGGYVTFGGGAKGGRITCKGTLKTGKLDFEDVYFVKEL
ncbi:hypothetical protein Tco_0347175 [Tanacetum coccineum]